MRILVDTHCWLWFLMTPERLGTEAREIMSEPEHELYLSAASVWEIVIKSALGKLELPSPPSEYIPSRLERMGYRSLAIEQRHALRLEELPAHHRDPFDRILIAQALSEEMRLLTADPAIQSYEASLLWAGKGSRP